MSNHTTKKSCPTEEEIQQAYGFFGLPEGSSFDTVQKTYRSYLKKYHPDKQKKSQDTSYQDVSQIYQNTRKYYHILFKYLELGLRPVRTSESVRVHGIENTTITQPYSTKDHHTFQQQMDEKNRQVEQTLQQQKRCQKNMSQLLHERSLDRSFIPLQEQTKQIDPRIHSERFHRLYETIQSTEPNQSSTPRQSQAIEELDSGEQYLTSTYHDDYMDIQSYGKELLQDISSSTPTNNPTNMMLDTIYGKPMATSLDKTVWDDILQSSQTQETSMQRMTNTATSGEMQNKIEERNRQRKEWWEC